MLWSVTEQRNKGSDVNRCREIFPFFSSLRPFKAAAKTHGNFTSFFTTLQKLQKLYNSTRSHWDVYRWGSSVQKAICLQPLARRQEQEMLFSPHSHKISRRYRCQCCHCVELYRPWCNAGGSVWCAGSAEVFVPPEISSSHRPHFRPGLDDHSGVGNLILDVFSRFLAWYLGGNLLL